MWRPINWEEDREIAPKSAVPVCTDCGEAFGPYGCFRQAKNEPEVCEWCHRHRNRMAQDKQR